VSNSYEIIKFTDVTIKYKTFDKSVEAIKHCIEVVNKFETEFQIE